MKMAESSLKGRGNTVGNGETARNEQFLLLPQCFQKTWTANSRKIKGLFGKGLEEKILVRDFILF